MKDIIEIRSAAANDAIKFVGGIGGFFAAIPVAHQAAQLLDLSKVSDAALLGASFVFAWLGIASLVVLVGRSWKLVWGRHHLAFDTRGVTRWRARRAKFWSWHELVAIETRHVLHEDARGAAQGASSAALAVRMAQAMSSGHWVVALVGTRSELEIRSLDVIDPDTALFTLQGWCKRSLDAELGDPTEIKRLELKSAR
ncbi:MAG: hypothetical protein AAF605_02775 [Myxococcota bacterium]